MSIIRNSILILILSFLIIYLAYTNLNNLEVNEKDIKISVKRIETIAYPLVKTSNQTNNFEKQVIETSPIVSQPIIQNQPTTEKVSSTYSTSVRYDVPGDTQSMSVKLVLQNNIIISVDTTHSMSGSKSSNYQKKFSNSYKSSVIGKDIKTLNLSRIAGASLTTDAFNQAIKSIRNSL